MKKISVALNLDEITVSFEMDGGSRANMTLGVEEASDWASDIYCVVAEAIAAGHGSYELDVTDMDGQEAGTLTVDFLDADALFADVMDAYFAWKASNHAIICRISEPPPEDDDHTPPP
ncbi:MAG: hypothetical protein ACYC3X_31310 [Pirellulaceae bacterium]